VGAVYQGIKRPSRETDKMKTLVLKWVALYLYYPICLLGMHSDSLTFTFTEPWWHSYDADALR
jgi:hypothetical protein